MRTIAFVGLTLLLLGTSAISEADEGKLPEGQARAVIQVSGMTCGDCCVKVEAAVAKINGVVDVKADYEEGVATVTYEKNKVDVKQIVEAINTKTSFKAIAPKEKPFSFTEWPIEFADHPSLLTPLKTPEEETFSFAGWPPFTPLALSTIDAGKLPEGQARAVVPVSGMTCGDCCVKVEAALAKIDGVVDVKADYEKGIATVTYEKDKVDVKQIVETINTKTSFKAKAC